MDGQSDLISNQSGEGNLSPQEQKQSFSKEDHSENPEQCKINNPEAEKNKILVDKISEYLKTTFELSDFFKLHEALNSSDLYQQHYGVIGLRKLLSKEDGPPIQAAIDANLVPRLFQFINNEQQPHLQLEAAWCLTNIASGTSQHAQVVVEQGGIPSFIKLLKSDKMDIVEQAVWGIGNLAGDSAAFRDMILKLGGLDPLLQVLNNTTRRSIVKNGIWALSNLCQGRPAADYNYIKEAIPTLCVIIKADQEIEVLTDSLRALAVISKKPQSIEVIHRQDIVPTLIRLIGNKNLAIDLSCLQILGGFASGDEIQTNAVLKDRDFLPKAFRCLQNSRKALRREIAWGLSNIAAGNSDQIGKIMNNSYYVDMLIKAAVSDVPEIQREVAWTFSNATKNCSPEQAVKMVDFGVLDCILHLLDLGDSKTVLVSLVGLQNILDWGQILASSNDTDNEFLNILEEKGGVAKLEDLQSHPDDEVYSLTQKILEKYFEVESFDDD